MKAFAEALRDDAETPLQRAYALGAEAALLQFNRLVSETGVGHLVEEEMEFGREVMRKMSEVNSATVLHAMEADLQRNGLSQD